MDAGYLKKIYPVIKGSVLFFMDFLVKQPGGKWYVTNPSTSPENFPKRPGNQPYFDEVAASIIPGTNICAGSSINMQILHDLFGYYIKAADVLHVDHKFADSVAAKRKLLLPPQIGKDGALQEWAQDWGQTEKYHRHLSPLYGLYPGNIFSFTKTPQFMDACRAVLVQRGGGSNEWSRAWKACLWSRLHDGNRADSILKGYFHSTCNMQFFGGFLNENIMQIDGTMGVTAGITEMLLQSQQGEIKLLPALPDTWSSGSFIGVCARGDFEINMKWQNKKILTVHLLSKAGTLCRIDVGRDAQVTCKGEEVKVNRRNDGSLEFKTIKGDTYIID